jgi:prepilin-type processing-associated H-X9-DG protein
MRTGSLSATRAFTRVEFLAVAATIFLLSFLISPSAASGRSQTRTTLCLSNLRHLVFAWQLYASDHDGVLPGNYTGGEAIYGAGASNPLNNPWALGWLTWDLHSDNTNINLIRQTRYARISDYILTPRNVHKCPSDTFQSAQQRARGMHRVRSVAVNSTLGGGNAVNGPWDPLYRQARTLSDIYRPSPAETTAIFDEHPDSINDPLCYAPRRTQWIDLPANHHNGAGSFSFADGHVALHPWRNPALRNHRVRFNFDFPRAPTGDPDLTWMSFTSQRSRDETY